MTDAVVLDLSSGMTRLLADADPSAQPLLLCEGARRVEALLDYLGAWKSSDGELLAFLAWKANDYRSEMRPIALDRPDVCAACGQKLAKGSRALWHPRTRTVLHSRRCPRPKGGS